MKRPLFGLALVVIVALVAGCANSARQPYLAATMQRSKSFALAVTVNGGLQPTPMQWAAIQAKFADEFAWRGWILVTDLSLADYIVRVDFTPDAIDPENTGTVAVLGIRNNPRNVLASMTTVSRYPTGYGYGYGYAGGFQNALWAPGFSSMYYGWGDSYDNGYSYSSPTLNPVKPPPAVVKTHPPYRHQNPDGTPYCPPDRTDRPHDHKWSRPSHLPGDFAAALPASTAPLPSLASSDRGRRWADRSSDGTTARTDSSSTSSSGITYSRGGSNSSSSDGTYARTDSNGTRNWSSWRERNSQSDSASSRTDSGSSSSSSSWRDRSSSGSGSTYSRSDSGYSRSGSDSSSSSRGSWGGSSGSGSSYSRSGDSSSSSGGGGWHSRSGSDSGYSRGSSSSSSGSSGSSYSGSSGSSSSSSGSSYSGGSSSSSSGSSSSSSSSSSGSSSTTGSVSGRGAQAN